MHIKGEVIKAVCAKLDARAEYAVSLTFSAITDLGYEVRKVPEPDPTTKEDT